MGKKAWSLPEVVGLFYIPTGTLLLPTLILHIILFIITIQSLLVVLICIFLMTTGVKYFSCV